MAAKKESSEEKKSSSRKKAPANADTPVEEKKCRRKNSRKDGVVETSEAVKEAQQEVVAEASLPEPIEVESTNEAAPDIQEKQADDEEKSEAAPVEETPKNDIKRYDIMITSENAGYRPPRAAVVSMVQQLSFRGFAKPVDEAVAEKWTEIYFEPGVSAHEIFIERAYESDIPVFKELCLRFSEKPFFCDYTSTPKRPLYWAIEIRGCRFTNPLGAFRKFFIDALHIRVDVAQRDFSSLPEHAVVPEDEKPIEKKKRERGAGIAGTEVQEM